MFISNLAPNITVNLEINACIYYCDSFTTALNASLIIAISVNVVTKGYHEKSKCEFLLLRFTSCRIIRNNKNITLISEFTVLL